MFRKPRERSAATVEVGVTPSTGRPPTPPSATSRSIMATTSTSPAALPNQLIPILGRSQTTLRGMGGSRTGSMGKAKAKANGSILNFFKRAELLTQSSSSTPEDDNSLFFEDHDTKQENKSPVQNPTPPRDSGDIVSIESTARYNEDPLPSKRRRMDHYSPVHSPSLNYAVQGAHGTKSTDNRNLKKQDSDETVPSSNLITDLSGDHVFDNGPFVEDPESEDEMFKQLIKAAFDDTHRPKEHKLDDVRLSDTFKEDPIEPSPPPVPLLVREGTSIVGGDGFDGFEDFIDDEFPADGEEYMERLWMDEQERLELGGNDSDEGSVLVKEELHDETAENQKPLESEDICPMCNVTLAGITPEEASVHVNDCLDGHPRPLPRLTLVKNEAKKEESSASSSNRRIQRAAIARPGQSNPFTFESPNVGQSSAFSKIMSSHAEDAAWATAAAAEAGSRGKPAFHRTCPFYKIMPGFFTCVDAFRYGAVEGCNAYFLSHFHSDHYIGLTSSWCHGPIYCSRVTGNLVRRQLRVDPKWVVDLEFDRKIEIPGTQGVEVTMIPANHCPGSSLYLFEKVVGKGTNPKVQRVLHCGDFRACPAHVQHPLLRPDVVDAITGKNIRQQKLDVCYLDTTYLTPKYAFPSQEQVIKACADMCMSLSKERVDETDDWEQTKKERAGSGMVKFVRKDSELIKQEPDEDDVDAMKVNRKAGLKSRGRLLVIVGTYSIGKERICLGVARALNSKIYAPPNKQKICAALEDPELMARLTNDPLEAQVHMQMLMEIRPETLADYLTEYKPRFSRIVGFRPSGWNYKPPNSRFVESPAVQTVLNSDNWKSKYSMAELVPQRGSTREASCFGVPYSEHSSFRELTMFCCALRIDKIIPTVNVGSAKSREKMKLWCEKWAVEKKKNGLFKVTNGQTSW
ncbi:hypothetical protein MMC13_002918 [Lambiella insularis]|nr:hypothetical protein [Lambiella insularis]